MPANKKPTKLRGLVSGGKKKSVSKKKLFFGALIAVAVLTAVGFGGKYLLTISKYNQAKAAAAGWTRLYAFTISIDRNGNASFSGKGFSYKGLAISACKQYISTPDGPRYRIKTLAIRTNNYALGTQLYSSSFTSSSSSSWWNNMQSLSIVTYTNYAFSVNSTYLFDSQSVNWGTSDMKNYSAKNISDC